MLLALVVFLLCFDNYLRCKKWPNGEAAAASQREDQCEEDEAGTALQTLWSTRTQPTLSVIAFLVLRLVIVIDWNTTRGDRVMTGI